MTTLALALILAGASIGQTPATASAPLKDLPDYVFAVLPEEENIDVLYFGEAGPTLVRFRLRIDGRGYRSAWDGFLARLYQFADANNDGTLTEAEAARPGWGQLLANPNGGIFSRMGPAPVQGDGKTVLETVAGKVSIQNFIRYARDGLGHSSLQNQVSFGQGPTDNHAFNRLDVDRDGALSKTELAAAEALIRALDTDEDEMIDSTELDPNPNPFNRVFFNGGGGPSVNDPLAGPFVPLASPEARTRAARRLMARSDGFDGSDRDGLLSLAESGLPFDAFRDADRNADRRLDLAEIERFLDDPTPALVFDVRLGKTPGQPASLQPSTPDPRLATKPNQGPSLEMDGREIEFVGNDSVQDQGARQFFEQRFELSDSNKDGAISRPESDASGIFQVIFDAADRDGDSRLTKPEMAAYLDRTTDLGLSRASITIVDAGRTFFDVLDADHDDRLSRRELREAAKHLKALDRDNDGQVRLAEIPNRFRILVGRGQFFANQRGIRFDNYDAQTPARPNSGGLPVAWFARMDRNHDGDVSLREFLGSPEDFRKLDADKDGLIDPKEAAKGP